MTFGIGALFALPVAIVLLLGWLSRDHIALKLSIVLALDWASSNVVVDLLGFERAPLALPTMSLLLALLVFAIALKHRSKVAWYVLVIYALVGAVHFVAHVLRVQGEYAYYAAQNILLLLALLVVGETSAWNLVRNKFSAGLSRVRANGASGSNMGRAP